MPTKSTHMALPKRTENPRSTQGKRGACGVNKIQCSRTFLSFVPFSKNVDEKIEIERLEYSKLTWKWRSPKKFILTNGVRLDQT